ncbi:MAG: hypothetical protein KAU49_04225 [Candidatus Krumholzibacteria bacterium]|nr:hypothetical protein [Candidatus Krumholzibacteria bacterium]
MDQERSGGGSGLNLFWGGIFTALAFVELNRGMYVIAGVPVWAICLFIIGIANFLKFPKITLAVAGSKDRLPLVERIANILNIAGLAVLVVSIAVAYLG